MKKIAPVLLLLTTLAACSQSGVQGNGKITSEQRSLKNFHKISVKGAFNVLLTTAKKQKVMVTVDSNLQPYIITKVVGDTLEISTKAEAKLNSDNLPAINIRVQKLEAIQASGTNRIKGTEILGKTLSIKSSGDSKIELEGKFENLDINSSGSIDVNTVALRADNVKIKLSGSGKVSVYASKHLDVSISGSGDVRYAGNPEVQQNISGDGKLNAIKR